MQTQPPRKHVLGSGFNSDSLTETINQWGQENVRDSIQRLMGVTLERNKKDRLLRVFGVSVRECIHSKVRCKSKQQDTEIDYSRPEIYKNVSFR